MILHTLNLGCSLITLRKPCINQRPRCDIAWLHVTNHLWSFVRDLWNHLVRLRIYWKEFIPWWWEDKKQLLPLGDTGSELKPLVPLSPVFVTSVWMLTDNPEFDTVSVVIVVVLVDLLASETASSACFQWDFYCFQISKFIACCL
jgi:hypothetical protein